MDEEAEEVTPEQLQQGKTITIEEAKTIMAAEKENRVRGCEQAITMVLQRFGCDLAAVASLTPDGRVSAKIQIIPKDLR